jgi:lysozyme
MTLILDAANIRLLKQELKREEGEKLKIYRCTQGYLTVGIGHKIVRGDQEYQKAVGTPITQARSTQLFEADVKRTLEELDKKIPWLKLQPPEVIRAVTNMAFQMGVKGVQNFRQMLQNLLDKDYEMAYTNGLRSLWARQTPGRARRVMTMIRNVKKE